MSEGRSPNIGASVRQRLLNLSKARKEDFQGLLIRYSLERFLYRLSLSVHASRFVLKGATLFSVWGCEQYRATRDIDMLAMGDNSVEGMEAVIKDICQVQVLDDGIEYLSETIRGFRIKEDQEYQGVRINLSSRLAQAIIPVQIDIGFGDAITPSPKRRDFPSLLNLPSPSLLIYPMETVVAEKVHAMVLLDRANSRIKDFYDLWILSRQVRFDGPTLAKAIQATFERRRARVPDGDSFILCQPDFMLDPSKQRQWEAFIQKNNLDVGNLGFLEITLALNDFLKPLISAICQNQPFEFIWVAPRWESKGYHENNRL